MVDIAGHQFPDFGERFDRGYKRAQGFRQDDATYRAGNALRQGDYAGAAGALYDEGMLEQGARVAATGQQQQDRVANREKAKQEAGAKFLLDAASRLSEYHHQVKDPAKTLAAFDYMAPQLAEYDTPEEVASLRQRFEADPDGTLILMGAGAAKEAGLEIVKGADGSYVAVDPKTGRPVHQFRPARTVSVAEGGALYEVPGSGGVSGEPAPQEGPMPTATSGPAASGEGVRAVVDSLTSAGARITSSKRTPEHNAAVGGAANSYHLSGHAFDIVPPPGMSMGELEQQLRSTGVKFAELINEGDHVHIAWGANASPAGGAAAGEVRDGGPRLLVERPKTADPMKELQTEKLRGEIDKQNRESADAGRKAELATQGMGDKAAIVTGAVDSALSHVGRLSAGFVGGNMAEIKGTPAYNLAREIDTIKANLSFDELQKMRASSPTGGALGAVSDTEIRLLGSTVASLDIGQSPAQLRANLAKIKQHYSAWKKAASGAPDGGGLPPQARAQLKPGHNTTFANGQTWTLRNGQPVQVK